MVEAAMSGFGPVMIGPGAATGGSCDFRSSLSCGLMDRMDAEQVIKTETRNLATAESELLKIEPIGIYKLFAREVTYRDKVKDQIVTEKTLVDEMNSESIGVWTDAGEHGTGTAYEYKTILSRASALAQFEGAATMFWISPAKKKRLDGWPEHRAYLWRKDEKGGVTAYSYQFTGENNVLAKTILNLSEGAAFFDTQTLLWSTDNDRVSHQRVFDAYQSSLTKEEKDEYQGFIERFRQDIEQPDSVLLQRIKEYEQDYEVKLRKAYAGDIQAAIEKAAGGLIALAQSAYDDEYLEMYGVGDRGFGQAVQERNLFTIEEKDKIEQIKVVEEVDNHEQKHDKQSDEAIGLIAQAFIVEVLDTPNDKHEERQNYLDDKDTNKLQDYGSGENTVDVVISEVIEPILPIILALTGKFAENLAVNGSITANDLLSPQLIVSQNQPPKNKTYYDNLYYLSESEKKASWQAVIAEILMFSREEATSGQAKEVTYYQRSQQQGFLQSLRHPRGVNWNMFDFLPMRVKEDEESMGANYNESKATIIADFQKVLEYIADLDPEITNEVVDKKEAAAEEEAVNLGRRILEIIFEGRKGLNQESDEGNFISFLLAVYDDENTQGKIKYILAVLIYKEINQLAEDKSLLARFPKLSSFREQLSELSRDAVPLGKNFSALKKTVNQLLMLIVPDDYPFSEIFRYVSDNILLVIFYIVGFIKLQRSYGRLSNTDKTKQILFKPRASKAKKRRKTLPLSGIIYSFSYKIVYQYRPLVIARPDMTQYE